MTWLSRWVHRLPPVESLDRAKAALALAEEQHAAAASETPRVDSALTRLGKQIEMNHLQELIFGGNRGRSH